METSFLNSVSSKTTPQSKLLKKTGQAAAPFRNAAHGRNAAVR